MTTLLAELKAEKDKVERQRHLYNLHHSLVLEEAESAIKYGQLGRYQRYALEADEVMNTVRQLDHQLAELQKRIDAQVSATDEASRLEYAYLHTDLNGDDLAREDG
jgi:hypothetical protein